ncbi:MAG: HAD hydrolase-like protein [Promethearchaeota archaeon]|nr:MAG: HAD hydrolase-like protein [Candidatus Lokiarchaeota archaeon]
MKETEKIVLSFDLDNTLINNRKGIVNSFNYALKKFNLPEMDKFKIEKLIGTPLDDMFAQLTSLNPSVLSSAFRDYYSIEGIYQSKLLPGVRKKLKELKKLNFSLGVITSKKQEMAVKILEYLKISDYFDYILGETEDRKVLGKLDPKLKDIFKNKYPNFKIIVIGDHPKDVMLSNNLNCPFIGVLTGNHSANELMKIKSNDVLIINSLKELTVDKISLLI